MVVLMYFIIICNAAGIFCSH